jgi:hypothetical protein
MDSYRESGHMVALRLSTLRLRLDMIHWHEPLCPIRLRQSMTRTDIKGVEWFNTISILSCLLNLSPRPLKVFQKLSKCLTSMPPVFPFFLSLYCHCRTLVTTSISPSAVGIGEPNTIHDPMMYQLYLCAVY